MAIITKKQKFGKHYFIHTYSDANLKIIQDQTGIIYDDAWDKLDAEYAYTESDIPIETESEAE